MSSISLTIPNDYNALKRAADMLMGMAEDINDQEMDFTKTIQLEREGKQLGEAVERLNHSFPATPTPPPVNDKGQVDLGLEPVVESPQLALAQDGITKIPFDARIHTGGAKKITQLGKWKLARGVDDHLVATVEAELKQLTATPAPVVEQPVVEQPAVLPPTAPAPVVEQPPIPAFLEPTKYRTSNGGEYTAEELRGHGWSDAQIATCEVVDQSTTPAPTITPAITFPVLMAKWQSSKAAGIVTDDMMNNALNAVSGGELLSLPLLAAKPDLVPQVYNYLFPSV